MNGPLRIVAVIAAIPIFGALGFMVIEGWSFFDALYMSVTTITTVGFREVHELSTAGRVFVLFYLAVGIGIFLHAVVQMGELVVRAELHDWLGKRRMDTALKSLKNHFIVCGGGRMGRSVCRHLAEEKLPFVVVERDTDVLRELEQEGWQWVAGDASDDRTLMLARVQEARGLASVLSDDADNLYIVLSARLLNPNLQIISRATDEMSAEKMRKAGANRVISPFHTGGMKMARMLARPNLEDFFEIFTSGGAQLDLAEILMEADNPHTNHTLKETDFSRLGVIIVGIRRESGDLILPATGSTRIEAGDRLIALGKADAISELGVHT